MAGIQDTAAHGLIVGISLWAFASELTFGTYVAVSLCAALLIEAYWGVFRLDA